MSVVPYSGRKRRSRSLLSRYGHNLNKAVKYGGEALAVMGSPELAAIYEAGKGAYNVGKRIFRGKRHKTAKGIVVADRGQIKRVSDKKNRGPKKKVTFRGLVKKVHALEKSNHENEMDLQYRRNDPLQVTSLVNKAGYGEVAFLSASSIESALNSVPYLNTGAPGTAATYDATALVQPTKWHIKCWAKMHARNNYNFPCDVTAYLCKPRTNTDVTPTSALAMLTKQQISGGTLDYTDPFIYPSDVPDFTETFRILSTKKVRLNSGDELIETWNKEIVYDQEERDTHSNTYNVDYHMFILVRVVGVPCHDKTTTTSVGLCPTRLDIVFDRRFKLKVPGSSTGMYKETNNNLNSIAAGPEIYGVSADAEQA